MVLQVFYLILLGFVVEVLIIVGELIVALGFAHFGLANEFLLFRRNMSGPITASHGRNLDFKFCRSVVNLQIFTPGKIFLFF